MKGEGLKMNEETPYQDRIAKVIEALKRTEMDALLLNRTGNIAYLTGAVNSCSWVFISKRGDLVALVLDSDIDTYREESVIADIRTFRDHDPFHLFKAVTKEMGLTQSKLGLELGRPGLPHHLLDMLRYAFPPSVQFVNGEKVLEELRVIKADEEIEAIKKAVQITELGMETAIKTIKPGIRESDVELEAEYAMRKAGGRIPVINYVASGKRSLMAHHTPSNKKIEAGEVVTLDIHGGFKGYCADLSRTVVCGKIEEEVKEAYEWLARAEEEAIHFCRKGVRLIEIKKIFYQKLAEAKGLKFLMGPVLHGVGIMNSEMPYFQFPHHEKGYPEILEANMVLALSNIGLYSKEGWGVRIEDTFLVTEGEPVYLTHYTRELLSV
jgi:Xaa-Pro aminopeptidase